MNGRTELFDNRLADWLEDDPVVAPPQLLETVLAAVPSIPQRRAGGAWRPAALPRWWQLAAAAALVVVLGLLGLRALNSPTVAPSQSPPPSPAASASAAASGAPTPSPRPTPSPAPPAVPLPDTLIGAWYNTAPGWWWFLRAGEPACVQAVRTDLDCVVWQRGTAPREIGIATMSGHNLQVAWHSGFCATITSLYTVALDADSLVLNDIGGGCQGGTFNFTKAGTGSAPTTPPPPGP